MHSKKIMIVSQCVASGNNDICAELRHFGYECVVVAHPNDLAEALKKESADALVCGLTFENESETALKILTQLNNDHQIPMPLVVFNEGDSAEKRLGAVRAGAAEYLVKPVDASDLVRVLDNVTQRTVSEPYRILIVDDDATLAMHTQLILNGAGMETTVVTDPMVLFEVLENISPELILLDIYMPDANGKEIAAVIRQKEAYAGIPIVFLSSECDKDEQLSALKLGGDDFLTKPIRPSHLISSVSIRAARFRQLRTFMVRDSMTGLYNHSTTKQFLTSELSRLQRTNEELSLVSIDIDFFKRVNDTHGHAVGDRVIKVLARLLRQRLRGADIVGRMGGEEFSAILPQTSAEKARGVFEKIRRDFGNIVFHGDGETQFSVTISLGIAAYQKGQSTVTLSDAADKALYRAKHNGRNQIVMAENFY